MNTNSSYCKKLAAHKGIGIAGIHCDCCRWTRSKKQARVYLNRFFRRVVAKRLQEESASC